MGDCNHLKKRAVQELGLKPGTTDFVEAASCHCRWGNLNCHDYLWFSKKVQQAAEQDGSSGAGGYSSGSTSLYQQLYHVPYRYNTAVIYDARQLHSALIDDATAAQLSCNATEGRLTANPFIV